MRGIVGALTALPSRAAGFVVYLPLRSFLGGGGLVTAEVVSTALWLWQSSVTGHRKRGGLGDLRGGFHAQDPAGAAQPGTPEAGRGLRHQHPLLSCSRTSALTPASPLPLQPP